MVKAAFVSMPVAALATHVSKKLVEFQQHQGVADFLKSEEIAPNERPNDCDF